MACLLRCFGAFCMRCCPVRSWDTTPCQQATLRLCDILDEASNFDVVLLAGMGSRRGESIEAFKIQGWQVVSSGFANSKMSNKSCGAAIALGPRFKSSRQFPPVESSGNFMEEVCQSELLIATLTSHQLLPISLLFRSSAFNTRTIVTHAKP